MSELWVHHKDTADSHAHPEGKQIVMDIGELNGEYVVLNGDWEPKLLNERLLHDLSPILGVGAWEQNVGECAHDG